MGRIRFFQIKGIAMALFFSLAAVISSPAYASLDPGSAYSKLLGQLSTFNPGTLPTREDQIAFWIDAYNIGAIKMIIDHYPTNSIKSAKINIFGNPWGKEILNINGRPYSLGEIEHDILIGRYREKKAHFAIVCASLSCPDITNEVYTGEKLKAQMERRARLFLNNLRKGYGSTSSTMTGT